MVARIRLEMDIRYVKLDQMKLLRWHKNYGPIMLLTTEPMRRNRKVLWWAIEAYLTRWKVEDTIRFIKQSYDFEDIRVLTYDRLKNMATLVLAASYFAAVRLGTGTKLRP